MKAIAAVVLAGLALMLLSSCVIPSSHYAPLAPVFQDARMPSDAPVLGDGVIGKKKGQASLQSILSVISWGDSSVLAAARDGGITQVKTLDTEVFCILGVYMRQTTIMTGE